MTNAPLVSVIMPVYDTERYLREAIESILAQTYKNFECIVVNDGSRDRSMEIARSFEDPRIIILDQARNEGLVSTMSRGIAHAKGRYLIRADADDVSLPARIERQVRFMEMHPDVGVLGTWMRTRGTLEGHLMKGFLEHENLRANLLFNTSLPQPSACMRASLFTEQGLSYDPAFTDGAEDYDLWSRAAEMTKLACLPEVLVRYRIHGGNVSSMRAEANARNTASIRDRQLASLGIVPSNEESSLHGHLDSKEHDATVFLEAQERWLQKLEDANRTTKRYAEKSFHAVLRHRWYLLCDRQAGRIGPTILSRAHRSPFAFSPKDTGVWAYGKFVLKALVRR